MVIRKKYPCEVDRIAYVEKGREYGVISIDKAESLNYNFYIEYEQNWQRLKDIADYIEKENNAYALALGGRTTLAEPDYSKFKAWRAKIEEKRQIGIELLSKLGYCFPEPMGIVKTVDIYW